MLSFSHILEYVNIQPIIKWQNNFLSIAQEEMTYAYEASSFKQGQVQLSVFIFIFFRSRKKLILELLELSHISLNIVFHRLKVHFDAVSIVKTYYFRCKTSLKCELGRF